MTELPWVSVVFVAAVAQLAVLPGEKVQFLIAGLSTRYRPTVVVGAAGAAFAGWTALEVWLGRALTRLLPGASLDVLTAGLFVLFAVLLIRSAPAADASESARADATETDGGELDIRVPLVGWRVPNALDGFIPIFAMMSFGEFGDKTQLITISLAAQYSAAPTAIWTGEMLAILPVSAANAYVFHRVAHRIDMRSAHLAGAALFSFFALDFTLSAVIGVSVWETGIDALITLASSV